MKKLLATMIFLLFTVPLITGNIFVKEYVESKGIWVWGSTLYETGVDNFVYEMVEHNFSDVYLLVKDVTGYYTFSLISELLNKANGKFRVHAWIICFQDYSQGGWIDVNSSSYRQYLINNIIIPLVEMGVDGICLDYIRYPGNAYGNTYPVTSFCMEVRNAVKSINPDCILSAAVMPEMEANAYYYGQDYAEMSRYMDVLMPMTYTHNYQMPPSWVGEVISFIKARASCKVQAIIQSLDDESVFMSNDELKACIECALKNDSNGISFFRYPVAEWQYEIIDEYVPFFDDIPPCIEIEYPLENSFYMFGYRIMSLYNKTVIIGSPRELKVNTTDNEGIEKVEFYIDDELVAEDTEEPYIFELSKGCYKIKVVSYDYSKNFASDEMNICLFCIS
ncbi:MAG: hypothetical protein DRN29_09665 [Thermoplasmata archaeon]|nr:MAG: hypothetical protein DRN29_09665 [Thermoplasmata archaeon]